jgi:ubiquitin-like protein Pup
MAGKEPSGQPPGPGGESGEADDVGAILDDMDEALEENAEEIVRSFKQEGGQ